MTDKVILTAVLIVTVCLHAVFGGASGAEDSVNMAVDAALSAPRDALYKSAGAMMLVWAGIAMYLFVIDRKISKIEKEINEK